MDGKWSMLTHLIVAGNSQLYAGNSILHLARLKKIRQTSIIAKTSIQNIGANVVGSWVRRGSVLCQVYLRCSHFWDNFDGQANTVLLL